MISAMTAYLLLLALLVATVVVVGVRVALRDRPLTPPTSRPDWGSPSMPSTPYVAGR